MRIVNEFAPGTVLGGTVYAPASPPSALRARRRGLLLRRVQAIVRLLARRRRAVRNESELQQLDSPARRDLGVGERSWWSAERELEYLRSASSRIAVRVVDAGL